MGLPRVGAVHPGVKYVKHCLLSILLLGLSFLPYAVFMAKFWDGGANTFPLCMMTGLNQLLPASVYLIYTPAYFLKGDPMFYRSTVRTVKDALQFISIFRH